MLFRSSVEKEDIDHAGDKIIETATYLSNTIESFRSLITQEKPFQNFPIEDSFQKAYSLIEGLFEKHYIKVDIINSSDDKIFVKDFANELTEVFLNILKNCVDILTYREVSPKVVHVSFIDLDDKIRITIHDNGGGIEEQKLYKILATYITTKEKRIGGVLGNYVTCESKKENLSDDLS